MLLIVASYFLKLPLPIIILVKSTTSIFSCSAGAGICNVTVDEIRNKTCLFTISRSWRDGDAIMKARRNHTDPVDAIVQLEDGKLLSKGKVRGNREESINLCKIIDSKLFFIVTVFTVS